MYYMPIDNIVIHANILLSIIWKDWMMNDLNDLEPFDQEDFDLFQDPFAWGEISPEDEAEAEVIDLDA